MILYASRYYLSHELREHEYLNASAFLTLRITQRKLCAPCENQQDRKTTNTQELSCSFSGLHLNPPLRLMYLVSKKCFCCDSQLRLSPVAAISQKEPDLSRLCLFFGQCRRTKDWPSFKTVLKIPPFHLQHN